MSWFGEDSNEASAYYQVDSISHGGAVSHELLGGAAAYAAAKAWDSNKETNGKPDSKFEAKEFVADAADAYIHNIVQTKGLDYIDSRKVNQLVSDYTNDSVSQEYDW